MSSRVKVIPYNNCETQENHFIIYYKIHAIVIIEEEIPCTQVVVQKADETQTLDGCLSGVLKPVQLIGLGIPLRMKNYTSNT